MESFYTTTMFGTIYGVPIHIASLVLILSITWILLFIRFCLHMSGLGVNLRGNKKKMTMILGPRGGGKTALFHRIRDGLFVDTVTSMTHQEGKFSIHPDYNTIGLGAHLTVIDYPGHERLRSRVADFYPVTSCVVFVVDAAEPSYRQAAEFLYDIFSNAKFNDLAPKMLIACNKSDLKNAVTSDAIRLGLEKELTKLQKTRSSLEMEGEDIETTSVPVGREGVAFEFIIDAPCEVTFVSCSVKEAQIELVTDFMLKN